MSEDQGFRYLTDLRLITCIVERGKADDVAKAAMAAGAPAATIYFARGSGIRERLSLMLKIAISPEKEVIDTVVPREVSEAVFQAMVDAGRLETPGKGFIFMLPVSKALFHVPAKGGEGIRKTGS